MDSLLQRYAASMESHDDSEEVIAVAVDNDDNVDIEIPPVQDVSEDELEAAEEVLEAAREEDEEAKKEIAYVAAVSEEAFDLLPELYEKMEILSHGLEQHEYSPHFAATVAGSLERYGLTVDGGTAPALEDYSHDNLEGYYRESLESFKGFVNRVVAAPFAVSRDRVGKLYKKLTDADREVKAINTKADDLLNRLSKLKDSEFKIKSGKMVVRSVVSTPNISTAVAASNKYLMDGVNTHVPAFSSYCEKVADIVGEILKSVSSDPTDKVKAVIDLKRPEEGFPNSSLILPFLGYIHEPLGTLSKEDLNESLKFIARREIYTIDTVEKDRGDKTKEYTLSRTDLQALLKGAKQAAAIQQALIKQVHAKVDRVFKDLEALSKMARGLSASQNRSWDNSKAVDNLAAVLTRASNDMLNFPLSLSWAAAVSSQAMLDAAKAVVSNAEKNTTKAD